MFEYLKGGSVAAFFRLLPRRGTADKDWHRTASCHLSAQCAHSKSPGHDDEVRMMQIQVRADEIPVLLRCRDCWPEVYTRTIGVEPEEIKRQKAEWRRHFDTMSMVEIVFTKDKMSVK